MKQCDDMPRRAECVARIKDGTIQIPRDLSSLGDLIQTGWDGTLRWFQHTSPRQRTPARSSRFLACAAVSRGVSAALTTMTAPSVREPRTCGSGKVFCVGPHVNK